MKFEPGLYLACGAFSLFFLISGARALKRKRITVVNPDSDSAWPGAMGALMKSVRDQSFRDPYDVPRVGGPGIQSHVELTGSDVVGMASLYLVLGTAFLLVAVFDFLMRNDLLSFLFD